MRIWNLLLSAFTEAEVSQADCQSFLLMNINIILSGISIGYQRAALVFIAIKLSTS